MPIFLMILATLFWGVSFMFIKLALQEISTTSFIFFRFLIATLSMLPVLFFFPTKIDRKISKVVGQGALLGALQTGVIFLQTLGLETISASLSGFLTGFYIVFVLMIRFIIQRKFPHWIDFIATLVCLGGLGLLTHSFEVSGGAGVLYTLGCAFFIAVHIYAIDAYAIGNNAVIYTFVQMLSITVFSGALLLLPGNTIQVPMRLDTWMMILFCGILCSSVSFWLQSKAQAKLGAFKISVILMLEPVFCTIAAYFFLQEKLYLASYVGIAMILISITVINVRLKSVEDTQGV